MDTLTTAHRHHVAEITLSAAPRPSDDDLPGLLPVAQAWLNGRAPGLLALDEADATALLLDLDNAGIVVLPRARVEALAAAPALPTPPAGAAYAVSYVVQAPTTTELTLLRHAMNHANSLAAGGHVVLARYYDGIGTMQARLAELDAAADQATAAFTAAYDAHHRAWEASGDRYDDAQVSYAKEAA